MIENKFNRLVKYVFPLLILIFEISNVRANRSQERMVENKFQSLMNESTELNHLEAVIHQTICNHANLKGELNYNEDEVIKITNCENMAYDQVKF